jgi:hypothetical protein
VGERFRTSPATDLRFGWRRRVAGRGRSAAPGGGRRWSGCSGERAAPVAHWGVRAAHVRWQGRNGELGGQESGLGGKARLPARGLRRRAPDAAVVWLGAVEGSCTSRRGNGAHIFDPRTALRPADRRRASGTRAPGDGGRTAGLCEERTAAQRPRQPWHARGMGKGSTA